MICDAGATRRGEAYLRNFRNMICSQTTVEKYRLGRGRLNLDVHASGQAQFIQGFDRLGRCLDDVDQPLVGPNLKLLTSLLIDVRAGKHRISLNSRGQWDRAMNFGIGPLGGIHNLHSTLVQDRVVISFHPDTNDFPSCGHVNSPTN